MTTRNPNNCKTCDNFSKLPREEGHCYMFKKPPNFVCAKHSGRVNFRDFVAAFKKKKTGGS